MQRIILPLIYWLFIAHWFEWNIFSGCSFYSGFSFAVAMQKNETKTRVIDF